MVIYQRMYDRENIKNFYLSPYIEYYIVSSAIYFYNFELEKMVRLEIENGDCLINTLIKGLSQNQLIQKLCDLCLEKKIAEQIMALLIQNKIIE